MNTNDIIINNRHMSQSCQASTHSEGPSPAEGSNVFNVKGAPKPRRASQPNAVIEKIGIQKETYEKLTTLVFFPAFMANRRYPAENQKIRKLQYLGWLADYPLNTKQ